VLEKNSHDMLHDRATDVSQIVLPCYGPL
jgi:hypothetical protein